MKFVTLMGSPRKEGNTATVLAWAEEELKARGHEIERINIIDRSIGYCDGCFRCQDAEGGTGCPMEDDAGVIFKRMIEADGFILASPLYCWGFSAPLKALLDRGVCLVKRPADGDPIYLLERKRAGLLVTAGGPDDGNADLITEVFNRFTEYLRCTRAGRLVVPYCRLNMEFGPNVEVQARDFAQDMVE
ncbi:MAG TPA: flavodoxin family protein [Candidatus Hydrogenedentes bacterium]|jgi:multimeric flavodoxin WrbA|nr:flavodoxin family protein [Candidatus Hydrogenedentota bacterium]HPJ98456.1 flavodoxin family protein [Candidatus Hydrogenedentota bacterium]